ncbi:MAG: response regulator transcription factor [Bryobacteraceae bacterium]
MRPSRILIVDDEPQVRKMLRTSLTRHGYEVWEASNGLEAHEAMREFEPDLVLLDLNMPGISGLEVCQSIRMGYDTPIIVLSVSDTDHDKVGLLDAGADDYVTKPFSMPELIARIRRALRRATPVEEAPRYQDERIEIDFESRRVLVQGNPVRLTPKELDVLRYLVARVGKPVSHRDLLRAVWGPDYGDEVAYLRVFINRLRAKIELDPAEPKYLLTEPWVGYSFAAPKVL